MIVHDWQDSPGEPSVALRAEAALLGCVLIGGTDALRLVEGVMTSDFSPRAHQLIWKAVLDLETEKREIDVLTVSAELERAGSLQAAGGWTYLNGLMDWIPDLSSIREYARIVREAALLRRRRSWGT